MNKQTLALLLMTLAPATSLAKNGVYYAAPMEIRGSLQELNSGIGVPVCVPARDGSGKNLFFKWKPSERYERKIFQAELKKDCSEWRKVWNSATLKWKSLSLDKKDPIVPELEQVRFGANRLRAEKTGAEFLARHPLRDFTVETNRTLSDLYGIGFAGEVYQAWIESQPANRKAKEIFLSHMAKVVAHPERARKELASRSKNLAALVVMGLGWESEATEKTPFYVRDFIEEIHSTGVKTFILERERMGSTWKNIELLKPQIRAHLEAGNDLILVGLCKGTPELLAATTEVLATFGDSKHGKILGVVSLSGMMGNVYLADFAESVPGHNVMEEFLQGLPLPAAREYGDYLEAMKYMATPETDRLRASFADRLPKDAVYLNVAGVLPGNALLGKNDTTAMGPFLILNRKLHVVSGANDGFLEHPETLITPAMAPKNHTLVFNGTHMLTDGSVGPYDLTEKNNRVAAYMTMYYTLFDLMKLHPEH